MKKIRLLSLVAMTLSLCSCGVRYITNASVNENGELIVTYDNSSTANLGNVKGEKGDKGDTGAQGEKGVDGINGIDGINGTDGKDGKDGVDGTNGVDGASGKSAYEIAVENGFEGTETEWLESLKGADGIDGIDGVDGKDGKDGDILIGTADVSTYFETLNASIFDADNKEVGDDMGEMFLTNDFTYTRQYGYKSLAEAYMYDNKTGLFSLNYNYDVRFYTDHSLTLKSYCSFYIKGTLQAVYTGNTEDERIVYITPYEKYKSLFTDWRFYN